MKPPKPRPEPKMKQPKLGHEPVNVFDPKAKCEKCGNEEVATIYCGHTLPGNTDPEMKEHFHRKCKRCEFGWVEKCISKQQGDSTDDVELKEVEK